jgi:ankyrin repeat protein
MSGSSTPRPARTLPAVPNLEQQRKQARELLESARAGDAAALDRFRTRHPRGSSLTQSAERAFKLSEAQLVIAREYGFPSWPKLKAHIEAVVAARQTRPFVRELSYYDDRARGLLAIIPDGIPHAIEQVRSWHPRFSASSDDEIRTSALTLDDARLIYARQHGFESWGALAAYLTRLANGSTPDPFMAVFEAGRAKDWSRVNAVLTRHPDVIRARGTNGNTLLNLASSLIACPAPNAGGADEPAEAAERLAPMRLLISAGADVDQANDRGWTPLHQAGYRNDPAMAELLLASGARIDLEAHGSGGTPLAAALFWGHREAAEVLAAAGVVPTNLRIAAGLGRADLVRACVGTDGRLTPGARAARGFYRPHSGFPAWQPSEDEQEVLDEALVWAAKSDRVEVMPLLVERGARVDADPYRGTPLAWASYKGRVAAARWLLDHGADIDQRGTFGGPGHGAGVTALHLAAQNDNPEMIRFLLSRGADRTIRDDLYSATPAGWAEYGGAKEALAALAG